ncbi:2-succinyl-5-enolpyruvyl-6-hydroxy-3-cyclohexene-1-carboxylic-acid synthase [Arthrobacter sp. H35-D1]|uniref:2-succinyl-5-enolpyruvyl-6-hydroxy-3- cyclohexene-1-carboxylic-acid synthase n=1 Tax=Arthrobacter sp. H35-D1 TaxID=3046202 RepID=UPI0024B9CC76|nr:2-succinyl-5-enolpyruvyl-6-hydroxy-3-cyclohexene-1-carboxylic-acid synthase [Arthrobacter sp. H35-D1]MDJ0312777.1 2-succinyl-5-enolpyruvyl-6-hydroxy-3-cyclohexene-1-carboxylic-acid synthase [Arthrobacter sp. H35-D1]
MDAARYVVDALERAGVDHVVVAPGSRSAPLVYALAEAEADGRLNCHVRIDERVAGFTALGIALGGDAPVAVVTTSGTAVGNLMPAVMEANHSGTPLIVLSADRPEELRGTGANQTTQQLDLFGDHVRFATDVPAGTDPTSAISTALSAARGRLEGIPAGPAQVNLAFRDPLTPALDGSEWERLLPVVKDPVVEGRGVEGRGVEEPEVEEPRGERCEPPGSGVPGSPGALRPVDAVPPPEEHGSPEVLPSTSHRTVVVAGHGAGPEAEYFARMLGLPLLAEPSSNARFGPNAVGPYRLLLDQFGPDSSQPIQRVVLFGRPTLSRQISGLLADASLERALFLPAAVSWFEAGRRTELILTQWDQLAGFAGRGPDGWLQAWLAASARAEAALDEVLEETGHMAAGGMLTGPRVARAIWARAQQDPGSNLMLGSSNPVRDVDLAGQPTAENQVTVHANRGLSGIDGTISTASGVALATGRATRVLLGDVTFLHDSGALAIGPTEQPVQLQVVVLNDAGGGIFSVLEHGKLAQAPNYASAVERFFGTPHTVQLAALAAAYGWEHRLVHTAAELDQTLATPVRGRSIIEVAASRAGLRELHARISKALEV